MTIETFSTHRNKEVSRTNTSRIVGNAPYLTVHRTVDCYRLQPSNEICQLHDNSINHGWTEIMPLFFDQLERAVRESPQSVEDRGSEPSSPQSARRQAPPPYLRRFHLPSRLGRPAKPARQTGDRLPA